MFKLKAFDDPSEKQARIAAIKTALESLPSHINTIRSIRVDANINPTEDWDLILTSEFDTIADVQAYSVHPAHIAVGRELIAPFRQARACVDYEIN